MIEGQAGKLDSTRGGVDKIRKQHRGCALRERGLCCQQRHNDQLLYAANGWQDVVQPVQNSAGFAVIVVAIRTEQHLGCNLPKAIDNAIDAKIRGTRGPDRAQARRGQHGDHRFGHIGQQARYPVSRADTERTQRGGEPGHLAVEIGISQLTARPCFQQTHQRGVVIPALQEIFREIEPGLRKPAGAGELIGGLKHLCPRLTHYAGKVPHFAPERSRLCHCPVVHSKVVCSIRHMAARGKPRGETGKLRARATFGGRFPKRLFRHTGILSPDSPEACRQVLQKSIIPMRRGHAYQRSRCPCGEFAFTLDGQDPA